MDGSNNSVAFEVVALTACPARLPDGIETEARNISALNSESLLDLPLELRQRVYEQQLEYPIRQHETSTEGELLKCYYEIRNSRFTGYYRPFIAAWATSSSRRSKAFAVFPTETHKSMALPSLHPPLMTLDEDDSIRQEAFVLYLRTKVAVELKQPPDYAAFKKWASEVPAPLIASMTCLHIFLFAQTRTVSNGITDLFAIDWCRRDGSMLPTFRLEISGGGTEFAVKGHATLMPESQARMTAAMDEWWTYRTGAALFDGTDLVAFVRHLKGLERERDDRAYQDKELLTGLWVFDTSETCIHVLDLELRVTMAYKRYEKLFVPEKLFGVTLARVSQS